MRYHSYKGKRTHILRAEQALGRSLPTGVEVHHVDGDKSNPDARLVICQDNGYHSLLHLRTKILRSGGNPNTDSWCSHCKRPRNKGEFYIRKSASGGKPAGVLTTTCKRCSLEKTNNWRWKTGRRVKGRLGRPKNNPVEVLQMPEVGPRGDGEDVQGV